MMPSSTTPITAEPSAVWAFAMAFFSALVARVLFGFADAGPLSGFLAPVFPFLAGGLGIFSARYAVQAWRATRSSGGSVVLFGLTILALLIDVAVIVFAAFIGVMLVTGRMVA